MQTFASFLEMSIPAHRGCTTSITHLTFRRPPMAAINSVQGVCSREGGEKQDSDTRAQTATIHGSRGSTNCALHLQTNLQAHGTIGGPGSTGTHPGSMLLP